MNAKSRYHKRVAGNPRLGQSKRAAILVAGFIMGTASVVAVFFILYHALGRSDFFQITAIRIQGCQKISKSQILEYSGIDIHTNLLALDVDAAEAKIVASPWIKRADIKKQWPNRLEISVKEHVPVAMVSFAGKLFYTDSGGNAFAEALPPGDRDYPVITGLPGSDPAAEDNEKTLKDALRFINQATLGNLNLPVQNISEINVSNLEDFVLYLVDNPFPIHLGTAAEGFKIKYARLSKVLSWLYRQKKFGSTKYINMGYQTEKILVGQNPL